MNKTWNNELSDNIKWKKSITNQNILKGDHNKNKNEIDK